MYRGYELLTWENRLVDVGARRIRKFHQTELEIRLCRVMKRIISQALAVWNRTLAWGNPNMDAEPVDAVFDDSWSQASWKNKASGKSLNLGQIRAGKVSGSGCSSGCRLSWLSPTVHISRCCPTSCHAIRSSSTSGL